MFLWQCKSEADRSITVKDHIHEHPLYKYIHDTVDVSKYDIIEVNQHSGYTEYIVKLVSQSWLSEEEVDATEWWHWVSIVVPDQVDHSKSMMWIGGGSRENDEPLAADIRFVEAAMATKSVMTHIHNIPFQPLYFKNDTVEYRYEDAIIALGWRKFLENGGRDEDAYYLSRFPMTRAVVLAMDATTEILQKEKNLTVDQFVVAGASKRGWTAWTTAAMDDRVVAVVPMVIDLLNLVPSFMHHWRSYGEWSPAVNEYVQEGIMDWMDSREYKRLLELTEPFSFRKKYAMPKLIVNATQDEFFLPDSWQFYRDSLPGETHFSYVPNVGHSLGGSYELETVMAFYRMILENKARPKLEWETTDIGFKIITDPENPPSEVKVWEAYNPNARDFRIYVLGEAWTYKTIPLNGDGVYDITLEAPGTGYKASMVEFTFAGQENLKLTTGVKVLPDVYPFEPFNPVTKKGTLLTN